MLVLCFPMLFLCFGYAFSTIPQCFSCVFRVLPLCFACAFPILSLCFDMLVRCFSYPLSILFLCFPYPFPMHSYARILKASWKSGNGKLRSPEGTCNFIPITRRGGRVSAARSALTLSPLSPYPLRFGEMLDPIPLSPLWTPLPN